MDIEALRDFLAAHASGGISAGARARGQPKQSVSRRIMALEAELGLRLIDRTTRSLRLTAEGAILRDRASRIIADLEDTKRALVDRALEPKGLLRISAPVLLGQTLLGAVAAQYLLAYPEAQLDIVLSDKRVDLVEDGFDAAIRVGPMDDSSLIGRHFATAETIVVAAPACIARVGQPASPSDLINKPCLIFAPGSMRTIWAFQRDTERLSVEIDGPATVSSIKLVLDLCVEGAGFAAVPAFLAEEALARQALVRVLPEWNLGQADLRIVFPTRRLMSARLRAFVDLLVAAFPDRRF